MKIAYEPHPVSTERKAELRAQGYKIIDALYAPAQPEPEQPERVKRAYRKRGGDDGADD